MWKHLISLGVILGFAKLYHLDLTPYYQKVVDHIASETPALLTNTVVLALIVIIVAFFVRIPLILGIVRLVVRIMQELSLFAICLISIGSIYWSIWEEGNPWKDLQPLLPIPAILLLSVIICTNIIDFNQPVLRELIPYLILAGTSFLLVSLVLT